MYSVLFVCTANICRSPMAVALLKARITDNEEKWKIESAGVWAQPGYPAAEKTQVVAQRRGIDLSDHRSRPITFQMVTEYNLVLTMERSHKEALHAAFPGYAKRIYLFWEMAGKFQDVVDPIGRTLADFEDTGMEMDAILDLGFETICQLARHTEDDNES